MGALRDAGATQFDVIVVGAGLCGLSMAISMSLAGHRVSVFEEHRGPHEFGAGVQTSPNGTRIFEAWGLGSAMRSIATTPQVFQIRRFDGAVLAQRRDYNTEVSDRYGHPLWMIHRVDLQEMLIRKATELGVRIFHSSKVIHVDCRKVSIELEDASRRYGDLVVVADGVWSELRSEVIGHEADAQETGDVAYRITVDVSEIPFHDEELRNWVREPRIQVWIGPGAHAVVYSFRGGTQINLVLLATQELQDQQRRVDGNVDELKKRFEGWDPLLHKLLDYVKVVNKWRLMHVPTLERWRSDNGQVVLAGDCCHAILPYMAQGLNMALEDAATLGFLVGRAETHEQLKEATAVYERLRMPRTEQLLRETQAIGNEFHLEPGAKQQERDKYLAKSLDSDEKGWLYPKSQDLIWSYHALDMAKKACENNPFYAEYRA
ncbi:putative monooxygenase [Nemania sp. FL0916]|nr:putative monooxygenase [Nemania sp. FL0916]